MDGKKYRSVLGRVGVWEWGGGGNRGGGIVLSVGGTYRMLLSCQYPAMHIVFVQVFCFEIKVSFERSVLVCKYIDVLCAKYINIHL